MVIVSLDGKYHGHVPNELAAKQLAIVKERSNLRLLSDEEWDSVVANPDERMKLCGSLGKELK